MTDQDVKETLVRGKIIACTLGRVTLAESEFLKLYDLITRQQAEIEKLQEIHADATESLRLAAEANKDMQAKIEGLEAEAVREFAEKVKEATYHYYDSDIDELVKEMDGDQNGKKL